MRLFHHALCSLVVMLPCVAMAAEPEQTAPAAPAAGAKAKPAKAKANPPQDRMQTCLAQANDQALQAHARKRFIGECMAGGAGGAERR